MRAQPMAGGYSEFSEDEAKVVPGLGEMGEPVVLSGREASLGENIMKTEAFNLVVSDKISYTRVTCIYNNQFLSNHASKYCG